MKPNKQKIYSSQPLKPGSASKLQNLASNSIQAARQSLTRDNERPAEFSLSSIVPSSSLKDYSQTTSQANPFKMLKFSSPNEGKAEDGVVRGKSHKMITPHMRRHGRFSNLMHHDAITDAGKQTFTEGLKDDEVCNNTTDTVKYKSESIDEYFGIFPNNYWCERCAKEVFSKVKLNLPTLSVWNRFCWGSCLPGADKFQEILHFCPNCAKVLEKIVPKVI